MRQVVVIPAAAATRVEPLLKAAGWQAVPAEDIREPDLIAALDVVRGGEPAIYVPAGAEPARELQRILVVHEGTRGDRAGMDVADEAAVASGAEIVVLHIPPSAPSTASASLPFRVADHGAYDWAEWREEFLRRFCRCSAGVRVSLHISAGSTSTLRNRVRDEAPDLVVVSGRGREEQRTLEALEADFDGVAPVLIVPSAGHERSASEKAEFSQRR